MENKQYRPLFKDEVIQEGDEYFAASDNCWKETGLIGLRVVSGNYRRIIKETV